MTGWPGDRRGSEDPTAPRRGQRRARESQENWPSQALGPRFQMVADDKQIFLVDLTNGRVWRYFHNTKEAGFTKEDEGFLPMPLYYAGQKHYAASEIEPPPAPPGSLPHSRAGGEAAAMSRVWRQDLAWAGYILGVAVLFGLVQQWPLVRQSWRGELTAKIEQMRDPAPSARIPGSENRQSGPGLRPVSAGPSPVH